MSLLEIESLIIDLDNTLHDYRRSSKLAMRWVISDISSKYSVDMESLYSCHKEILEECTTSGFVDGRSSFEYRHQRFTLLLDRMNLDTTDAYINHLLDLYEEQLRLNTLPYDGVPGTLEKLSYRKSLYLATEGPEDAQVKTLNWLGIDKFFSGVFTSNRTGKRKYDGGLFRYIIDSTGCNPMKTLVVGDSYKNDMLGAKKAGLNSIWVSESKSGVLSIESFSSIGVFF